METEIKTEPKSLHMGVTPKEEQEAHVAEQKRPTKPISVSGYKKVDRYHELSEIMAPFKAEQEKLKAEVAAEMDRKGVDVLTRKGVEVVSRDEYTQVTTDSKGIESMFPEIAAQFIKRKINYRFNWKKRVR